MLNNIKHIVVKRRGGREIVVSKEWYHGYAHDLLNVGRTIKCLVINYDGIDDYFERKFDGRSLIGF